METMPYHDQPAVAAVTAATRPAAAESVCESNWRNALPVLTGSRMTLRELRSSDAPSLCEMLTTEEVSRFISPPPTTVEGFQRFIAWARTQQELGAYACFAVVPQGSGAAVGLFQIRQLDRDFATAEWGFAIGSPFWGTGIFLEGAHQIVNFAFEVLGVCRLEARASVLNKRGNGALQKVGAVREAILRRSFFRNGSYHDQILWSILKEDWLHAKAVWGPKYH